MFCGIPHATDTARYAAEVAGVEVKVPMVVAQAAIQRKVVESLAYCRITADIEKLISRDERLLAKVM